MKSKSGLIVIKKSFTCNTGKGTVAYVTVEKTITFQEENNKKNKRYGNKEEK